MAGRKCLEGKKESQIFPYSAKAIETPRLFALFAMMKVSLRARWPIQSTDAVEIFSRIGSAAAHA
jgi:hypothetical protein